MKVYRGLPWREEEMVMGFFVCNPIKVIQNNSCKKVVCNYYYVRFGIYLRTENINRKHIRKATRLKWKFMIVLVSIIML